MADDASDQVHGRSFESNAPHLKKASVAFSHLPALSEIQLHTHSSFFHRYCLILKSPICDVTDIADWQFASVSQSQVNRKAAEGIWFGI